jgi:hypothetical protein
MLLGEMCENSPLVVVRFFTRPHLIWFASNIRGLLRII